MKLSAAILATALSMVCAIDQVILSGPASDDNRQPVFTVEDVLQQVERVMPAGALSAEDSFKVKQSLYGLPAKAHRRRPASHWDFFVRGADVDEALAAQAASLEHDEDAPWQRQAGDGYLDNYSMRARTVDPSGLKIDTVKQFSGYVDLEDEDKHFFFWFFESRNDPENDPVILWLNGGPGCSSLTGLFLELGPSMLDDDCKPINNPFSWNTNASVIFLDNPVNTGFSYSSKPVKTSTAASKDVYALLSLFFHQFPQYSQQEFHIAGESYAGRYIPVFATEILSHPIRNINLRSLLIGNGLVDPYIQFASYRPMACGEGGYPAVLSPPDCQSMDNALPRCQYLLDSCYQYETEFQCVPATLYCQNAMWRPYSQSGQNPYDVRLKCEGPLCYGHVRNVTSYLNQREVIDAVGAEVDSFDPCSSSVGSGFTFSGDHSMPFHRLLPSLLEQIPVLVYAGDADFICNWLGNLAWTNALDWPGNPDFAGTPLQPLFAARTAAAAHGDGDDDDDDGHDSSYGAVKSGGNLTFVQLYGAGHLAPMDKPEPLLQMVNGWIRNQLATAT